ncbi:unnamed protein product [Nezara viridula]|uniref:Uncharacterized protein n=1 Tax=Nezara viridula TaxID=85310 RepID=A0A9P0GZ21_NEZVI|nr:unnamed protein product [Nezara viridula]
MGCISLDRMRRIRIG